MTTATLPAPVSAYAGKALSFEYTFLPVSDLQVKLTEDPKTGRKVVDRILVKDEPLAPTDRFWTSLYARYGINSSVFKYFDHAEVFERINQKESDDRMRICIERAEDGAGTMLAVSNPGKPIVVYDELMGLLGRYDAEGVTYHNGIVESVHTPRNGSNTFKVAGDDFMNRFVMGTAIDGYGAPAIYLSLLRTICENGVVGYSKHFKSTLALGKADDDVGPTLTRALDGFGNDEGYAALRQRLEQAALSWCSVYESGSLYKMLVKMTHRKLIEDLGGVTPEGARKIAACLSAANVTETEDTLGSPVIKAFHGLTGDTSKIYGLANLDALSAKRQRTLPVKCTVYDAINFATEVSSHYATPAGARMLQGWVGTTVTEEYDMEGTKDKFGDFADFHIGAKLAAGLTGSENSGS